jgi:ferric-dicitrate binding protein FerR (iron transport regulator)
VAWRARIDRPHRSRWRWLLLLGPPLATAAVLLLVLGKASDEEPVVPAAQVARFVRGQATSDADGRVGFAVGESLAANSVVRTGIGDLAVISLATGAEVRLNTGTVVRLAAEGRLQVETGQVYIDTGRRTGSVVSVDTPVGTVRDIGTRFDVRVAGDTLRVRVREGTVRLDTGGKPIEAGAGWQILVQNGSASVTPSATHGADWAWTMRASPFTIEGATLEAFLNWIEIEGGLRIVFAPPSLRNEAARTVLHGSVEGMTIDEALTTVLPASGMSHTTSGDRIIVGRQTGR